MGINISFSNLFYSEYIKIYIYGFSFMMYVNCVIMK